MISAQERIKIIQTVTVRKADVCANRNQNQHFFCNYVMANEKQFGLIYQTRSLKPSLKL